MTDHTHPAHWGYTGDIGPDHWGDLDPAYSFCSLGRNQSPVDIVNPMAQPVEALTFAYGRAPLRIINNGHTIQVNCAPGNTLRVGERSYTLRQFHFHAPSEHTIAGRYAAMEAHFVHQAEDGELAVVGVMIERGDANPAYALTWAHLPAEEGAEQRYEVEVDLGALLPRTLAAYRYTGSLTTPPCTENVRWFVLTQPVELAGAQVAAFEAIIKGNNRPVQPLNGRVILVDPQ